MAFRKVTLLFCTVLMVLVLCLGAQEQADTAKSDVAGKTDEMAKQSDQERNQQRQEMMERHRKMREAMQDPQKMRELLVESGVSEKLLDQTNAALNRPVYVDEPLTLLSQADQLKLTAEQKKKLEALVKDMRAKALAVLTAEQKKALGAVSDQPTSTMELMGNLMQVGTDTSDPYMYPMMRSMIMNMLGIDQMMRPVRRAQRPEAAGRMAPQQQGMSEKGKAQSNQPSIAQDQKQ